MEMTVLTGLTAVGGILVFPLIIEFFRQHLPVFVAGIFLLIMLATLSPHSPEARALWLPISNLPNTFVQAINSGTDGVSKLGSEYFNAFHQ